MRPREGWGRSIMSSPQLLIGREGSRDFDTDLTLVETDHVTQILTWDWSVNSISAPSLSSLAQSDARTDFQ